MMELVCIIDRNHQLFFFFWIAQVHTAAVIPASKIPPFYAEQMGFERTAVPHAFIQGWIPTFEVAEDPQVKYPSSRVCAQNRTCLYVSRHDVVGMQSLELLFGKLPPAISFLIGSKSQALRINTSARDWAVALYKAVKVVSPIFPDFDIEFCNE